VLCSEGDTPSEPPTGLYAIGGWLEADITLKALEALLKKLKSKYGRNFREAFSRIIR
jgi:hypothetical protein